MSSSTAKIIGIVIIILLLFGGFAVVRSIWDFPHGSFDRFFHNFDSDHFWRGFWGWPAFGLGVGLLGLAFLFIWIAIIVWVYRDAEKRRMNAVIWALIVFLTHLVGLLVYLLVRSDHPIIAPSAGAPAAACPRCAKPLGHEHAFCPHCGEKIRPGCPKCGAEIQPGWKACPHCGEKL
jgi:hypothetical protein